MNPITPDQLNALVGVARGRSVEAIAEASGEPVNTVASRLRTAMLKLEARTYAQAVAEAFKAGIITKEML
ncbi:MAG: hypothetical protein KGI91_16935 [Burkholderiales bacterium]|nr:hypothetical protein [Burkholderiales bacterium]